LDEATIIRLEDSNYASGYQKLPVTVVKGKGAVVWDVNGREYIDCMTGYGVALVGHCNHRVVEAVKRQVETLITCHGSLYNDIRASLLDIMSKIAPKGLDRTFLVNSGAEAVECALKLARKYTGKHELLAMTGSFHGKTLGALSATWNPKYRKPYEPLLPGFKFAPFGDLGKVKEAVTDKTSAVIVEPVQGESGIQMAPDGFLQGLREICDGRGTLLICDEVQSGFGRTGKMWACEHWGVIPDILCAGKGMAGGLPMGATLARSDIMEAFKPGDHGSTFGGNPLACAASLAAIEYILDDGLLTRASRTGAVFKEGLKKLKEKYRVIRDVRGLGLMLALELRFDVRDLLLNALKEGLLSLYSGRNILRLLPPLIIEGSQIQEALEILDRVLSVEERAKLGSTP
jgi:acetylornithine/LysW-gamma-L-lysine aminotransferase